MPPHDGMPRQIATPSRTAWKAWPLLPCLALLAFSGCGTIAAGPDNQTALIQKGRIAPQTYLSSVIVVYVIYAATLSRRLVGARSDRLPGGDHR